MLAIDIGAGTQDLLVAEEPTENSVKLVLPSPTVAKAREVEETEGPLHVIGTTMGGGPVSRALSRKAETHRVTITPEAARTVRDNPAEVEEAGLEITSERPESSAEVRLADVDPDRLRSALGTLGVDAPDRVAVAVQDHGDAPPGTSDREYRIEHFRETMGSDGAELSDFAFTGETERFTRISAVVRTLRDHGADPLVTDTKLASVAGALPGELPALVVDAGNGHTMAALVDEDRRVTSILEHHTSMLDGDLMDDYLDRMLTGELAHRDVFDDGGHGACSVAEPEPESFVKTGPRRSLLDGSRHPFEDAHPLGDVMMTGPYGLFRFAREVW